MNDPLLKLVVYHDPRTQRYKPLAHNLTMAEAGKRVQKLLDSGIGAASISQQARHRASSPDRCKSCRKAAKEFPQQLEKGYW